MRRFCGFAPRLPVGAAGVKNGADDGAWGMLRALGGNGGVGCKWLNGRMFCYIFIKYEGFRSVGSDFICIFAIEILTVYEYRTDTDC